MSEAPNELKYSKSHEWIRDEGDGVFSVGITDHAQDQLGDLVFVELPEVGDSVSAGDECAVVESVKAASDLYAPFSGEVVATNQEVEDAPEIINDSPYDDGWIFKLKISDVSEMDDLLDAEGYLAHCDDEHH